jgi:hypothetical protein
MTFSYSGESWDHEIPERNAQPRLTSRLGRFFSSLKEIPALIILSSIFVAFIFTDFLDGIFLMKFSKDSHAS